MRYKSLIIHLCILATMLTPPLLAQEADNSLDLSVSLTGGGMYGYTLYRLEDMQMVPETDWYVGVKSELKFPLDMFVAGAKLQLTKKNPKGFGWTASVQYLTNVNDPNGSMEDSDWILYSTFGYFKDMQFSYTKSDVDLTSHYIDASFLTRLPSKKRLKFTIGGGLQYRRYSFNVYGVEGWYVNGTGRQVNFVDYQDEKVGKYRATYVITYFSLGGEMHYKQNTVYLLCKGTPFVFATDFDDHLLRFKTGEGDCSGSYFAVESGIDWLLAKGEKLTRWAIEIRAEYSIISTDGTQVQTWYGDDPASLDDDTGSSVTLNDYDMASKTLMFKARLKYAF